VVSAAGGATDAAVSVTGAFASEGGISFPRKSIGIAINAAPSRTAPPSINADQWRATPAGDEVLKVPLADCHDGGGVLIRPLRDCQPGADDVCGVANGIVDVER